MDRSQWDIVVRDFGWTCPTCGKGTLRPIEDSFKSEETAESQVVHSKAEWEVDWLRWRFCGLLRCDNPSCKEVVAVAGDKRVEEAQFSWDDIQFVEKYEVKAVIPSPLPFTMASAVPQEVRDRLAAAAGAYWFDADAAANKIRQAVEALLTHQGIAIYPRTGPRRTIALHQRILEFAKKQPGAAEFLLATKWIGNAGSHQGGLSRDAVLDGFEMVEHVLDELYVKSRAKLLAKAKKINKSKGRIGQKKKKI